jgi:anti-anti-sigma factor
MEQLKLLEKKGANYVLLEVSGTINSYTFSEFQSKLYTLVTDTNVVVDMSLVTNIDSSGLGVILAAFNDAEESGYRLYIMRPSNEARKALESTGFIDFFPIIQAVTEAL